jgi:hypothetical protein
MLDIPVNHVQVVQEHIVSVPQVSERYQFSELDLSFCAELVSPTMCSGDASSGPSRVKAT